MSKSDKRSMARAATVFFAALAAALVLAFLFTRRTDRTEPVDPVRLSVERYIRPGYLAFDTAMKTLTASMQDLCDTPAGRGLADARGAFGDAVRAWSRIEFVQFGPVREENRLDRILFFPDRRGIGLRQIQALLAKQDRAAIEPETFASKSAALQGLPALEFVLFGSGSTELASPPAHGYRCDTGYAIASNVMDLAGKLVDQWQDGARIVSLLNSPGEKNPLFASRDEAQAAILRTLPNGYETIGEVRLNPVIGQNPGDANPKAAIWWRSGLTGDSIKANFEGLEALARESRLLDHLVDDKSSQLLAEYKYDSADAVRMLDGLGVPVPEAAETVDGNVQLAKVRNAALRLRQVSVIGLVDRMGLTVGFSSLDGD